MEQKLRFKAEDDTAEKMNFDIPRHFYNSATDCVIKKMNLLELVVSSVVQN